MPQKSWRTFGVSAAEHRRSSSPASRLGAIRLFLFLVAAAAILAIPVRAVGQPNPLSVPVPDGSEVLIHRDAFGVPHVVAQTEFGLFFAQGFVAGVDRFVQLEQLRRASEGRISEIPLLGASLVDSDRDVRRDFYTQAERLAQFESLDERFQTMLEAYTAGVNRFLDSMRVHPDRYRPPEALLLETLLGRPIEPWSVTNSVATTQFMLRQFGQFGGQELTRLAELQANGPDWFEIHRPINDPDVPTTIPPEESGSPVGVSKPGAVSFSAIRYPTVDPDLVRSIRQREEAVKRARGEHGIPNTFGSFAVLVAQARSSESAPMLLGAPQMLVPDSNTTSIVYEIELQSPTLHIAGIALAGIPGILIGRNGYFAWSLTSGMSDNTDVFIETTEDTTFSRYLHQGEWLEFEVIVDTIVTSGQSEEYVHYRTVHGPVFASDLGQKQVFSKQMTFWNAELKVVEAFDQIWRATTLDEFRDGAALVPMSFNLFYAGVDGNVAFWHIGRYRERDEATDPRLPRNGDGSQEWPGLVDFFDQPSVVNPSQGYLVNWNNKPSAGWDNGDNIPWALQNELDEEMAADRVLVIDEIVGRNTAVSFEDLQAVPREMTMECEGREVELDCYTRGSYEQILVMRASEQDAANILPPGQTASPLLPLIGSAGPHANDQWPLYSSFEYKPMPFGAFAPVSVEDGAPPGRCGGSLESCVFRLQGAYPNPTRHTTSIVFELARPERVGIQLMDVLGRVVRPDQALVLGAGSHEIAVSLADLSSGMYFYRIEAAGAVATSAILVID